LCSCAGYSSLSVSLATSYTNWSSTTPENCRYSSTRLGYLRKYTTQWNALNRRKSWRKQNTNQKQNKLIGLDSTLVIWAWIRVNTVTSTLPEAINVVCVCYCLAIRRSRNPKRASGAKKAFIVTRYLIIACSRNSRACDALLCNQVSFTSHELIWARVMNGNVHIARTGVRELCDLVRCVCSQSVRSMSMRRGVGLWAGQLTLWVYRRATYRERKCADTSGTVLVPWAGHFQC